MDRTNRPTRSQRWVWGVAALAASIVAACAPPPPNGAPDTEPINPTNEIARVEPPATPAPSSQSPAKPPASPLDPPPPGTSPPAAPAAPANPSAPPLQPARPPPRVTDIYAFIACASANNPTGRWSEPRFVERGWASIVDGVVMTRYRQGYRRFYVDSPFGKETDAKGVPQFGFFGYLRVGRESPWRLGFVDAWWRVTRLSGIRVIAYLGNPHADAEFKRVLAERGRGAALEMLRQAVAPIRAAGFHGLGIDASFDTDEDSPLGDLMKELHDAGMEVYVEGPPSTGKPWLTRFGVIRTTWMARWMAETSAKAAGQPLPVFAPSECRGERIQLFSGTIPWKESDGRPWESWGPRWIKECLEGGERPAVPLAGFPGDARRALGVE